ncbi:hypothetical protein LXT21_36130 [Myxococcus sp. K38C18041901]|uniref:hypothetical protein n=1 Tax=Myxococcus guangdongensis TaxID=2906760 RepID=UPI0020A824F0|nr:hypothetical protein [Myxococcus guangdongensis]MCP3064216.1 hypothetical protein [Myxococcus guangdongensis]
MTALLCALSLVVLTQSPVVSVSFDLRALPEQDYRRWDGVELERKVALRLIQEGFAVVSARGPAQVRLSASRAPEGLLLEAVGPRQRVEQSVRVGRGSIAELHLEVAQKLAEMTRAVQPEPEPEPEPPQSEPVLQAPVEVAAAPSRAALDLGLGLGTLWGGPGVAPHWLLSVRWGLGDWGLDAEAGLGVSREPALNVFEVQGGAFVSYRHAVTERLRLEPAVGAGLVVHAFRLEDTWVSGQRGTQVSPAGWARMKLGWRFTERLAVEARAALGLLRPVTHVREGEALWSRGGVRLETGVQLSWGL